MKKVIIKYGIIAGAALILAIAIFLIVFFNRSIVVPEVVGKGITEATEILNDVGFKVSTSSKYSDKISKDNVISQEIKGGDKAKYGTKIVLVVSKGKEQITLPDLINCTSAQAEETLKELGFSVFFSEEFSNTIPKGNVVDQSVFAGKQADKGSAITLIISKGPDLVTVPNIRGMTLERAEQALKDAGLKLKTEIQFSNTIKEDYIISQDIAGNTQALRNSVVNAKVSAGVLNKAGTTPSNANSYGKVTSQGNWIYFAGTDQSIYRMRKDKSEIQQICKYPAVSVNVIGEWIYFTDGAVGGIYKVKIDGTGETKISNVTSYKLYVEGDWIYYTSKYWGGKLYKMKTDGSSVTQIIDEECREFIVNGGYIYYLDESDYMVYKCTTDGKNKTILCAGFNGYHLTLVGGRLVITNNYNVKSVNLDGSGFTSFGTTNVQYDLLNGNNGWLYYLEHDFRYGDTGVAVFGRMKPDGSQKTDIYEYKYLNHSNSYLNVVDDWIYFQNEHEGDAIYRVNINGTGFERVG